MFDSNPTSKKQEKPPTFCSILKKTREKIVSKKRCNTTEKRQQLKADKGKLNKTFKFTDLLSKKRSRKKHYTTHYKNKTTTSTCTYKTESIFDESLSYSNSDNATKIEYHKLRIQWSPRFVPLRRNLYVLADISI